MAPATSRARTPPGPLAFNGGPTQTMVLKRGSPAINKGGGCSEFDQRSVRRIACDIGSYERRLIRGVLVNLVGTSAGTRSRAPEGRTPSSDSAAGTCCAGAEGATSWSAAGAATSDIGGPGRDVYRGCEIRR